MSTFFNLAGKTYEVATLSGMTPAQLLAVHNEAARFGNQPEVKRFSDKGAALRRTKAMLAAVATPADKPANPAEEVFPAKENDVAKTKTPKEPKEPGARRGRASQYTDEMKINLVNGKPKHREGTTAEALSSHFKSGMTVGAYRKAVADSQISEKDLAPGHLRWSVGKGLITIG